VYHYRREYDRSLEICRQALELSPDDIELHVVVGLNYEQKKMYAEAIQEIECALKLADNNPLIWGPLGSCCAAAGDCGRALGLLAQIEELSKSAYVAYITPAMICLGLKDYDRAFDWLEKAADAREVLLCYLAVGPIYDGIRNHPRYMPLLKRLGLASHSDATSMTE
jgi:tetratricopeptide (TPR) repeat protein